MGAIVFGDWGTSRLRLFRMEGRRIARQAEGMGFGGLDRAPRDELLRVLRLLDAEKSGTRVFLCGMAGARHSLIEAPYIDCPAAAATWRRSCARIEMENIVISVAPGLACINEDGAPDVMRGEETQIFGAIALDPTLARGAHTIVLPGTHSKWAHVRDGAVLSFRTFLTGELFALLKTHSTLTRVGADTAPGGDAEGFEAGLRSAEADGELLSVLFTARSAQLRENRSTNWATGYLSGLLIGREARAARSLQQLTLVGASTLTSPYHRAFEAQGVSCSIIDGDQCAIAGLNVFAEERALT